MPIYPSCSCDRLDRVLGLADAFCPMHGLEQPSLTLLDLAEGCEREAAVARLDARLYWALAGLGLVCTVLAAALGSWAGALALLGYTGVNFMVGRRRRLNRQQLLRAALLGRTVADR